MTSSIQGTTSSTTAATSAISTSQVAATQDRFLKLLVTQLQNQDPLNPMDNAAVTSQMAQLSTVNGIDQLNSTVQALSASMATSQSLQATSMIGHAALVPRPGREGGAARLGHVAFGRGAAAGGRRAAWAWQVQAHTRNRFR